MKNSAYKVIAQKYFEKTKLRHEPKQFKNRFSQCKTMYQWLKWADGETGLGRRENGAIIADDEWWDKHTKKKYSECKKFKRFMPTYLDQLAEMFHGTTVDGRSSCIPGESDDCDDGTLRSPSSSSSRKRKSSTTDTATSPVKKHKSAMVKCMKGLIDTIQAANNTDVDVAKQIQDHITKRKLEAKQLEEQQVEEKIERCMELVKECGATEETEEFYVATMLFAKKYHRTVFLKLTTNAGRMAWLKKCSRDWSAGII
ncbi:Unknown protein [Striga hermonthica]|uniref:Myb/SANT-like domain-containing protein n=1 Tax=Striga hermonthica TaxID=68872 RepID=A0A9N7MH48_STRHE|nr:Unknown protein [Striga hermonthica]